MSEGLYDLLFIIENLSNVIFKTILLILIVIFMKKKGK